MRVRVHAHAFVCLCVMCAYQRPMCFFTYFTNVKVTPQRSHAARAVFTKIEIKQIEKKAFKRKRLKSISEVKNSKCLLQKNIINMINVITYEFWRLCDPEPDVVCDRPH